MSRGRPPFLPFPLGPVFARPEMDSSRFPLTSQSPESVASSLLPPWENITFCLVSLSGGSPFVPGINTLATLIGSKIGALSRKLSERRFDRWWQASGPVVPFDME